MQDRIYIYILSLGTKGLYTLFSTLLFFHFIYLRTLSILIHREVVQFVCFLTSLHIIPLHKYTMINLTSPLLVDI